MTLKLILSNTKITVFTGTSYLSSRMLNKRRYFLVVISTVTVRTKLHYKKNVVSSAQNIYLCLKKYYQINNIIISIIL